MNDAVLHPQTWADALKHLADACQAGSAFLQLIGGDGFQSVASRGSEDVVSDYVAGGWHEWNPRMERGLALTRRGVKGLVTERHMFTPEELARDAFQQDFAVRHEISSTAGLVAGAHAGSQLVLTIERGTRAGPFSEGELVAMNRLVGEASNALSFALRLKLSGTEAMIDVMSRRGEAVALLNASGGVLRLTAGFEGLIGKPLAVVSGRLRASDPADDNRLSALIAKSSSRPPLPAAELVPILIGTRSGRPLIVRCLPVTGAGLDILQLGRVAVIADDVVRPVGQGASDLLNAHFGLTAAEIRLAVRLGNGEPLRSAADAEGVSYESARTRLKMIFEKTGTYRQTDLARLIGRLGG